MPESNRLGLGNQRFAFLNCGQIRSSLPQAQPMLRWTEMKQTNSHLWPSCCFFKINQLRGKGGRRCHRMYTRSNGLVRDVYNHNSDQITGIKGGEAATAAVTCAVLTSAISCRDLVELLIEEFQSSDDRDPGAIALRRIVCRFRLLWARRILKPII
jgi:hypothetical protein